ncbi:uncharacterized protein [Choristoneura fumiferana]|uniref:uncharacterized protein n=1 Tax=Choristoneura fumiferana TaxID=7141 RepID=UPI003D158B63
MEKETSSLLKQILTAAALNLSDEDIAESATLKDLGMATDNAKDVSSLLRFKHNISIDKEQVPFLSIQKIRDIEEMLKESNYSPKKAWVPYSRMSILMNYWPRLIWCPC